MKNAIIIGQAATAIVGMVYVSAKAVPSAVGRGSDSMLSNNNLKGWTVRVTASAMCCS